MLKNLPSSFLFLSLSWVAKRIGSKDLKTTMAANNLMVTAYDICTYETFRGELSWSPMIFHWLFAYDINNFCLVSLVVVHVRR